MAANLLRAGLPVLVFDRNPAAVDKLIKLGAKAAGSPQEIGSTPGVCVGWVGGEACHGLKMLLSCVVGVLVVARRSSWLGPLCLLTNLYVAYIVPTP